MKNKTKDTLIAELIGQDFGYGPLTLENATHHASWHPASGHIGGWRIVRGISPLEQLEGRTGRIVLFGSLANAQRRANTLNSNP